MLETAGGMRGGFVRRGGLSPSESAHDFEFDMDRSDVQWYQDDHSGNA
jgi:hypothetical protein